MPLSLRVHPFRFGNRADPVHSALGSRSPQGAGGAPDGLRALERRSSGRAAAEIHDCAREARLRGAPAVH